MWVTDEETGAHTKQDNNCIWKNCSWNRKCSLQNMILLNSILSQITVSTPFIIIQNIQIICCFQKNKCIKLVVKKELLNTKSHNPTSGWNRQELAPGYPTQGFPTVPHDLCSTKGCYRQYEFLLISPLLLLFPQTYSHDLEQCSQTSFYNTFTRLHDRLTPWELLPHDNLLAWKEQRHICRHTHLWNLTPPCIYHTDAQ